MGSIATRTASEKTPLTPSRLFAEHSKTPAALMALASFLASPSLTKLDVVDVVDVDGIA